MIKGRQRASPLQGKLAQGLLVSLGLKRRGLQNRKYPKWVYTPTWEEEKGHYVASIPELTGITGIGKNWASAQMEMTRLYNAQRRIIKLLELIKNGQSAKKCD
jgi:hypothetical protein